MSGIKYRTNAKTTVYMRKLIDCFQRDKTIFKHYFNPSNYNLIVPDKIYLTIGLESYSIYFIIFYFFKNRENIRVLR